MDRALDLRVSVRAYMDRADRKWGRRRPCRTRRLPAPPVLAAPSGAQAPPWHPASPGERQAPHPPLSTQTQQEITTASMLPHLHLSPNVYDSRGTAVAHLFYIGYRTRYSHLPGRAGQCGPPIYQATGRSGATGRDCIVTGHRDCTAGRHRDRTASGHRDQTRLLGTVTRHTGSSRPGTTESCLFVDI